MSRSSVNGWARVAGAGLVLLLIGTACTDPRGLDAGRDQGDPGQRVLVNITEDANSRVETLRKGTFVPPDSTPRPAAKDKKIVYLSSGQSSPSASVPGQGVLEAAAAIGWEAEVYDAQLNPANYPNLVRQAIQSGADGIVANIDCPDARSALAEARAAGVEVVPLFGYDCDADVFGARRSEPLFSSYVNYGVDTDDLGAVAEAYGVVNADSIIAATNGQAKVILFSVPTRTVLYYTNKGFKERMAQCGGCQILTEIEFTFADLGLNLAQRAGAALAQFPEANAIRTPFTAATLFSIGPALVQSGRTNEVHVAGGEGFKEDLDLIRGNRGLDSCAVTDSVWTGWATVDTLNSLFIGQEPKVSGLGTVLIDIDHNLPPSGDYAQKIDFRKVYRYAWGVQ